MKMKIYSKEKLIKALFSKTISEQISGLILLSEETEPDIGWLLQVLIELKTPQILKTVLSKRE